MITKEEFINVILTIKQYWEQEKKLTDCFHGFFMNGHSVVNFTGNLQEVTLKLLAKNISEKYYDDILQDIESFVYEHLIFNTPYEVSYIKDGIKKEYKINTIDKLYDFIQEFYVNTKGANNEDI